jgi:AbrB family looped-hinge helix DNA binding protein
MATLVTTKGQVTIPKKLRDRYGIKPGALIDFVAGADGIQLRKVVKKEAGTVLGCLRRELTGRKVSALLDELRGEVNLPQKRHR